MSSEPLPALPSTADALVNTYKQLNGLLIPTTFAYPLVEDFAEAHDPLLVEHGEKILTASIVLREAAVQMDTITRSLERTGSTEAVITPTSTSVSLAEIKKARLRARLQSQSQPSLTSSKQALIREVQQRRSEFDKQMDEEEHAALHAFKKGLRDAVLLTSGPV